MLAMLAVWFGRSCANLSSKFPGLPSSVLVNTKDDLSLHSAAPNWKLAKTGMKKKEEVVEENPSTGRKPRRGWSISLLLRGDWPGVHPDILIGCPVQHGVLGDAVQHGVLGDAVQ